MTLTEKWKKGELSDGFYYFKLPDGSTDIASEYKMIRYRLTKDADKVEILAQVPSYEEWDKMRKDFLHLKNIASSLLAGIYNTFKPEEIFIQKQINQENKQFRQLLKECKEFFEEENPKDFTVISERMDDLLTRINAVIGESEE